MTTNTYTFVVALLLGAGIQGLVAAYIFAVRAVQLAHGWDDWIGFGAVLAFCFFYVATALFVPRWPPITCMRMGTYVFTVFAICSMLPMDPALFIVSFALLGFVSMSQSVLLSWWGKMQLDRVPVVVARMVMVSVATNIPLAVWGALLNARAVDSQLAFAVAGLLVGCATSLVLCKSCYTHVFHIDVVDSHNLVTPYVSNPLALRHAYDMEQDTFVDVPLDPHPRKSVELSDVKQQPKLVLSPPKPTPQALTLSLDDEDRKDIELNMSMGVDDGSEIDVPSEVPSSSHGGGSAALYPVNRPTFEKVTPSHQQQLSLWLGPWTCVLTFSTDSLLYYNIAGFTVHYETPWYVIVVVIALYTAMIMGALFVFTRVGDSTRRIRYLWWYRWTWYLLMLAAWLNAVLLMTEYGTNYVWHSALSFMYMLPLTVVSTMPLSRAQQLCQDHNYSFHAQLGQWTRHTATARATAYVVEYAVIYYNRQLSMMFALAALNSVMYFRVRSDDRRRTAEAELGETHGDTATF